MGQISGNWITGLHSGRACKHESIYTRVNKKTGKCYTAKLCNPNTEANATQLSVRSSFGLVNKAVSEWITANKVSTGSANADYKKVKKMFDSQSVYATLRGFMVAKGMYTVSNDHQTVTVSADARTDFRTAFGIGTSTGSGTGTGGGSTSGGGGTTGGGSTSGGGGGYGD